MQRAFSISMMIEPVRVLVVDDHKEVFDCFRDGVIDSCESLIVEYSGSYQIAFDAMVTNEYDVFVINYEIGTRQGLELLQKSTLYGCEKPVIMMGTGPQNMADHAIINGANNYLDKDLISYQHLSKSVQHAHRQYMNQKSLREQTYRQEKELKDLKSSFKNLIDSINYAKNIQDILLIDRKELFDLYGEYLIIYKPKDIVSGDFYYATEQHGYKYLAVADCTGHGVPGAFMSILCNDLLKQALMKHRNTDDILSNVDYTLRRELKQHLKGGVSDGMDIALIRIDEKQHEIQFSGAHRPCLLLRNNAFAMYYGDRKAIGYSAFQPRESRFTRQQFRYQKGDHIFLYTDGYADQFGGTRNRKFSSKRFRNLILENSYLPLSQQSEILNNRFHEWKQQKVQTDDVLVLGIEMH